MKLKARVTCLITAVLLAVTAPAFPYGYGTAGEDPLITMFKEIVVEAKKEEKDWNKIKEIIEDSKEPILNLDKFSNTNLMDKFNTSIKEKNIKDVIGSSVNLIYLSMIEKFELIKRQKLEDYDFAKGRLALNDKFYRDIFSANIKKYDKKNGTDIDEEILTDLKNIQDTIGKPGKFGIKGKPPDPEEFNKMYKNIKRNLKVVFPDFEG